MLGDVPLTAGPEPTRGVVVAWPEGRDELLVGRVPGPACGLVEHLAARPWLLPPGQGDALVARLGQLEALLPLVLPAGLPSSEASPRPRLLLTPRGPDLASGLRASLRVRPLAPDAAPVGPVFLPGEGQTELLRLDERSGLGRARRDLAAEVATARTATEGLGFQEPATPWTWELELDAAVTLLSSLRDAPPPGLAVEWPEGERLRVSRAAQVGDLQVTVRDARSWFELDGEVDVDGERVALALVLQALRRFQPSLASMARLDRLVSTPPAGLDAALARDDVARKPAVPW